MKKQGGIIAVLLAVAVLFSCCCVFSLDKTNCYASDKIEQALLPVSFASTPEQALAIYGIKQSEIDWFTPHDESTASRLPGKSFTPLLVGEEGFKHINAEVLIGSQIQNVDLAGKNYADLKVCMWINFDQRISSITRTLTIELCDDAKTNTIKWEISPDTLKELIKNETISDYDDKLFGQSNPMIGWCRFELPFTKGTVSQDAELVVANKLVFTKLSLTQSDGVAGDQPISFYNITLQEDSNAKTITCDKQDYANIQLKATAEISKAGEKFYIGEFFAKFLSVNKVYDCCYVGRTNYIDQSNYENLVVEVDPGKGMDHIEKYFYGTQQFKLSNPEYTIRYGLIYDDDFVSILSGKITATNYKKGVWFNAGVDEITIGKQQKLYYTVHEAFSGASISFESTDESLLKIIEIDESKKFVLVEALAEGEVGITIHVVDDRLIGSDYEETGIINNDFKIQVVEEIKTVNKTKIMLWIALALLLIGLIYLAVKAIIDARKVEVR